MIVPMSLQARLCEDATYVYVDVHGNKQPITHGEVSCNLQRNSNDLIHSLPL